ncbi:hypothetical protein [Streptomyces sp. SCL15-4]|nr:hypothetical protein [Streptomyces sp. SCL15-4]
MTVQDIDRSAFVKEWEEWHRAKEEALAGPRGLGGRPGAARGRLAPPLRP